MIRCFKNKALKSKLKRDWLMWLMIKIKHMFGRDTINKVTFKRKKRIKKWEKWERLNLETLLETLTRINGVVMDQLVIISSKEKLTNAWYVKGGKLRATTEKFIVASLSKKLELILNINFE